jgi:hypothetical protein
MGVNESADEQHADNKYPMIHDGENECKHTPIHEFTVLVFNKMPQNQIPYSE